MDSVATRLCPAKGSAKAAPGEGMYPRRLAVESGSLDTREILDLLGGTYEQHTKKVSETLGCRVSVGGECGSNAAR